MQYRIPLKIVSYKELYGWTMDEIVQQIGLKNNCEQLQMFTNSLKYLTIYAKALFVVYSEGKHQTEEL